MTEKRFRAGTHRTRTPAETLDWLQPRLSDFGITRIANITGLDRIGIPVVTVYRPNSRSLATSQGKGLTVAAAKASALMESIELYHGEHVELPLMLGDTRSFRRRHPVVDTELLPRVQCSRFSLDLEILWARGVDLVTQERALVPYELVHTSARIPSPPGSGCFASTSNGLSGGNNFIEACVHAICEIIERDSTTMWEIQTLHKKSLTRIQPDTIDDSSCKQLLARCAAAAIDVAVWETTSDLGVPSFLCQIMDNSENGSRLVNSFTGMGCHPCRPIALIRAITEAVQCRLTLIAGSRDDLFRREYGNYRRGTIVPPLYGDLHTRYAPSRSFADVPNHESETFEEDLEWILQRLATVGIKSAIAVDLTKQEFHIPVVRMIVPGLEGPDDDPDYSPGPRARALME